MIRIAIDGPGGAGKSSVAKAVASELQIIYVDTGALYRTIGMYMINSGIDLKNSQEVINHLGDFTLELKFIDGKQVILLDGVDVGDNIRTPEVSMAASAVSAIPEVRQYILDMQRNIAENNSVIMDGRDIGTVVLPNAQVKIFLTADDTERAMRRYKELQEKGSSVTYQEVLDDLRVRDYNDSHREIAPLKPAEDSVIVNTTNYTLEESIDKIVKTVEEKL